jgi:energy-coupling factor transporter ATP-binding protein EcfA2
VDLTLGDGEGLAPGGRSGGGKTTLGRGLAGLRRNHHGQVLINNRPLPRSPRARDRREPAAVPSVSRGPKAAFDGRRTVRSGSRGRSYGCAGSAPDAAPAGRLITRDLGIGAGASGAPYPAASGSTSTASPCAAGPAAGFGHQGAGGCGDGLRAEESQMPESLDSTGFAANCALMPELMEG